MRTRGDHLDPPPATPQRGGDAGPRQRRLATAGRADHHHRALLTQALQASGDVVRSTEEPVAVVDVVGDQPLVGTLRAGPRQHVAYRQRRVLLQDRLLELDELRARVEPELAAQHPAYLAKGPERVGLPAGPVLRQRQQRPTPLPQRSLLDQRHQLGQDLRVLTGAQGAVQAQLLGVQPQLGEAFRLDPPLMPVRDVRQRVPPPQPEGLLQQVPGAVGRTEDEQLAGPVQQSFEVAGVHVVATHCQPIALGEGLDRLVTQQPPQTHHAALEVLAPRRRRVVTPHRVGELVGAEHLAVRGGQRL